MESCLGFHNLARGFINLTAGCGYQGKGQVRQGLQIALFAIFLSPHVQPLSLRLPVKQFATDLKVRATYRGQERHKCITMSQASNSY
jgi:hypothetical protein